MFQSSAGAAVCKKPEDAVNVGSQKQVNVMSMEDDEFSTDDEHVSACHVF